MGEASSGSICGQKPEKGHRFENCKEGNTTDEYDYSGILKFTEEDTYFYLFTNADMVLRIHKDAFIVDNADEFREFANCKIQNHSGKREVV